ncbi:hypothetical protein Lal_00043486 [Lupinus albus]|nr:hypothetical protein Lal_00043486 [Lupinus albus]
MRVPVARLPTSSRGPRPPEARAVGDPAGWTILAGRLEALFPLGGGDKVTYNVVCGIASGHAHGALAWCPVCGSWSAVVGCFVHGVWFLVRDPEC